MNIKNRDKFNFFVPANLLQKSFEGENGKEVPIEIDGICLTSQKDRQGEELIPKDFDFGPLLKSGFLNWNHQASSTSKAIIGEPTAVEVRDGGASLFVKGIIYPNEEGKNVINLANTLEEYSPERRLGFSIEGTAIQRDPSNPKKVLKAVLTGLAITHCPVGHNTLLNIIKGDYQEAYQVNDDEDTEKAMETNIDTQKESVEGKKKEVLEEDRVLNKGEIYKKIIQSVEFEDENEVYTLISNIDMSKNPIKVGDLSKALAILQGQEDINKSEDGKEEGAGSSKKPEEGKEEGKQEDGDEKGLEKSNNHILIAESLKKSGHSEEEIKKSLTLIGLEQEQVSTIMTRIESVEVIKSFDANEIVDQLSKGMDISKSFDGQFGAIGQLLGGIMENQNTMKKSLETILATPMQKSVTATGYKERFEKSENGNGAEGQMSVSELVPKLLHRAGELRKSGTPDIGLENATSELTLAGQTDMNAISEHLVAVGYK